MIREKFYILLFVLLNATIPLLAVDTPRGLAFAPTIIGLIFYGAYFFTFDTKPYFSWKTLWFALIVFGLSALSLLWALHFDVSLKQVFKLGFLLPPQILLLSLALSLTQSQLKPYIYLFSYSFVLASLFLGFEMLSEGVIFNFIRGESIHVAADPDEFNRSCVVLSLYSFVAFAILRGYTKRSFSYLLMAPPLVTVLLLSHSQSAQLSFIVGLVFLFLFPYRSKLAWRSLTFIILLLMLTAPFFISLIYQNYASDIQNLPMMARAYAGHRLEIWDYIGRYALQNPLYGYGIEVTRETSFDSGRAFEDGNTVLHPHNFAMQIWIEFGLIGILIAMGLVYILLSSIQRNFTQTQQKIILPTLMTAMVPASFAYGLWQGWWISMLFHLTAMCLIACKFTKDDIND